VICPAVWESVLSLVNFVTVWLNDNIIQWDQTKYLQFTDKG
jgi:hypothetical protein